MTRSLKAAIAAGAAMTSMFAGTALAHDPEQLGTPLQQPFGERFSFIANFPTSADPRPGATNPRLTSSDIAFFGDLAYVGDYGGFRIFDVSKPKPRLVNDVRCYGPQGDPSVIDTDGDGDADVLTLSVDSVLAGPQCGAFNVGKPPVDPNNPTKDRDFPAGAWEGLRVFDVSDPRKVTQVAAVYQDCGSHTNTLLPNPKGGSMFVLNSSYPLGEGPTCGPEGTEADNAAAYGISPRKVNHGVVQVIEIPFSNPAAAKEITELPVVYPGDEDGTYRPASEQSLAGVLDNFLGCHDLSVFPARGIVGAACGEQAQVWRINKSTGLPDTANPMWSYDQPNVDFWHSATFSWDGKVANFIDESFGDGCPTVTTKRGQKMAGNMDNTQPKLFETGNMFFFETDSGDLLSEYRIKRGTNDNRSKGEAGTYCSSHLGLPVPSKDRYLLVDAYYRGGTSIIDFTDPTQPEEIAFADMDGTNTWSAYPYPRKNGAQHTVPIYSNDGLGRAYVVRNPDGTPVLNPDGTTKVEYREEAYGFQRFQADIGKANIVGLDRLNPQLQEQVIKTNVAPPKSQRNKPRTYATGKPTSKRIKGARPADK